MTESIDAIKTAIIAYRVANDPTGDEIVKWLQIITTHNFTLSEAKAEAYKRWQRVVFDKVKEFDGKNISRAENIADIQVPELVLLRHLLKASESVVDAMRSHLSHLKHQQQTI